MVTVTRGGTHASVGVVRRGSLDAGPNIPRIRVYPLHPLMHITGAATTVR